MKDAAGLKLRQPAVIEPPASWLQPERHLSRVLDHPWYSHLLHLLDAGVWGAHLYLRERGATQALVPLTTGSISSPMGKGSDSEPVLATIAGRDIYLADSMQFMLELAVRMGGASYYIMPSFRGETSDHRHLNQFFHVEVEVRGGQEEAMDWAEGLTRSVAGQLLDAAAAHLQALGADLSRIADFAGGQGRFLRIRCDDAVDLLRDEPGSVQACAGRLVLTSRGEAEICRRLGDFTWVTNMPRATVPFYQAVVPGHAHETATADLLAGIGEILGLGERAESEAEVLANLDFCEVAPDPYGWYLDMKRTRPLRTAGFGLGLERFLMWCVGRSDIRDFCLLLRDSSGLGSP
jgi:asparaginyl-tRNA synthetase